MYQSYHAGTSTIITTSRFDSFGFVNEEETNVTKYNVASTNMHSSTNYTRERI